MISQEIRYFMLDCINVWVQFQLVLMMGLAGWTWFLLGFRRRREKRLVWWDQIHDKQIVDEFLSLLEETPEKILKTKWGAIYKNKSLRDSLLKQIGAIVGDERDYFVERYRELGFLKKDLRVCRSFDWSLRLAAVLRLNQLGLSELAPLFDRMRGDRHPIVSATAIYALSSLVSTHNAPDAERLHGIMIEGRRNLLLGVVTNWGKIYGFHAVFDACRRVKDEALRNAVYIAAVETKEPEAVHFMIRILCMIELQPAFKLSNEVIIEILKTLHIIGDPSALTVAKSYVAFPHDGVKLKAIELVMTFGEQADFDYVFAQTRFASLEVKRLVDEMMNNKIAEVA